MDAKAETDRLLKVFGAQLKRDHRHEVWHVAGFGVFVRAKTPSDKNEAWADLTTLRRLLGLNQGRGEGERRERKVRTEIRPIRERFTPVFNPLADKLREVGLSEDGLKARLAGAESRAEHLQNLIEDYEFASEMAADEIDRLRRGVDKISARRCSCFGCRTIDILNQLWRRLLLLPVEAVTRGGR